MVKRLAAKRAMLMFCIFWLPLIVVYEPILGLALSAAIAVLAKSVFSVECGKETGYANNNFRPRA
jgi:hypothetical protein